MFKIMSHKKRSFAQEKKVKNKNDNFTIFAINEN